MNSSEIDEMPSGQPDIAQIYTDNPIYNQALMKSRYLQWSNRDNFALSITDARLSPQAERYMFTLWDMLTDHINSLTTLTRDDIYDLELAREIHFIAAKSDFTTADVNSSQFWALIRSMFGLQDLTWKMALGGNERLLQNRTDSYQMVSQNQSLQMPGENAEKKRGFRFWRR